MVFFVLYFILCCTDDRCMDDAGPTVLTRLSDTRMLADLTTGTYALQASPMPFEQIDRTARLTRCETRQSRRCRSGDGGRTDGRRVRRGTTVPDTCRVETPRTPFGRLTILSPKGTPLGVVASVGRRHAELPLGCYLSAARLACTRRCHVTSMRRIRSRRNRLVPSTGPA